MNSSAAIVSARYKCHKYKSRYFKNRIFGVVWIIRNYF